ncbi:hypothetical protein ABK040_011299 [Willaertia magna]
MKLENTIHYCTLCKEDEEESIATHYCNNCNQNLCEGHLILHNKKKLNKDHNLTNLLPEQQQEEEKQQLLSTSTSPSTTASSNSSNIVYKEHHYCKHHEGLVTDIYCKGCDDVICSKCAAFNHKLHDYVDINEIVKEEKEKMKPLIEDLQFKKEILLQRINEVKTTSEKMKEQANLVNNDIDILFTELQKLLNEKKEKLTIELNEIIKNKLNTLQNEETLLNEHYNNCNELCQLNNNNIEIFQNKINLKLKKEVNDLNELNVINNLEFMSHIKLRIDKDKLINLINNNLDNLENTRISIDKLLFKNKEQVKNDFNLIKFEEITKFEGNENTELIRPQDIVYNNNLIYIADTFNNRVLILDNLFNYKNEIELLGPYSLSLNNKYLYIGCLIPQKQQQDDDNNNIKTNNDSINGDKETSLHSSNYVRDEQSYFVKEFKYEILSNNERMKMIEELSKTHYVYKLKGRSRTYKYKFNDSTYLVYNEIQYKNCDNLYCVFTIYGDYNNLQTTNNNLQLEQMSPFIKLKEIFTNKIKPCLSKFQQLLYLSESNLFTNFIEKNIFPSYLRNYLNNNKEYSQISNDNSISSITIDSLFEREEKAIQLIAFLEDSREAHYDSDRFTQKQLQGFYFLALTNDFSLEDCDSDEQAFL